MCRMDWKEGIEAGRSVISLSLWYNVTGGQFGDM